jgi:hypothetical protein
MSQQFAIAMMIDIGAALRANTLEGSIYLFDNMKSQGSQGQGTGDLVTAINGTYWFDGSQANEQVLNWMVLGLDASLTKLPGTKQSDKTRASAPQRLAAGTKPLAGTRNAVAGKAEETIRDAGYFAPIITDITGEAVDKKVIYLAQYGSPDPDTDGWYWSGSVDTTRPGMYSYTMHFILHKPYLSGGKNAWEPVSMTHNARIRIANGPKINGFTKKGMGFLPIV